MARILFQFIFPILLPALLYALWLTTAERRRIKAGAEEKGRWGDAPWLWLLALGLFFATLITVAVSVFDGGSPTGVYVPSTVNEDGRPIPGRIEPR